MDMTNLSGSIVALVTPFKANRTIDFDALGKLVDWHIEQGTDGILVLGTTGESSTMTDNEDYEVAKFVVDRVAGRIPVIGGSGSNSTDESLRKSIGLQKIGVDGLLLITPYYNKSNEDGIYHHFKTVLDAVHVPCILYNMRNLVEKTSHKPFFKSFNRMARVCTAGAIPALVIALVIAIPALKASNSVSFTYGSGSNVAATSQVKIDEGIINDAFGESQTWAIMVPEGNWAEENALVKELQDLPTTKNVLSYSTIAGSALPTELGDKSQVSQLLNGGYSRIVLTSSIPDESQQVFDLVDQVRSICKDHYGDDYGLVGNAVSYSDIKAVTASDNMTVKIASILAIGIVLLVMFKSVSLPLILISAIEVSIWINEAVPYFQGDTINFVAFLVIDAVQLGAAVDYAIIYTEEYLARRKRMYKGEASFQSIEATAQPIMTSSSILILACMGIYLSVSSPMISQVGLLIARGALISVIEIFFVLPLLFKIMDWVVQRTSYKLDFYQGDAERDRQDDQAPKGIPAEASSSSK